MIARLCTIDPQFPMHLWDRLLPQCDYTLNMLRASRINPILSAYHHLYSAYNYDTNPMVFPGTKSSFMRSHNNVDPGIFTVRKVGI